MRVVWQIDMFHVCAGASWCEFVVQSRMIVPDIVHLLVGLTV